MAMIKKAFKFMMVTVAALLLLLIVTGTIFMNVSPEFGGSPSAEQQQRFAKSAHYSNGTFQNAVPTTLDIGFANTIRILYDFLFKDRPGLEPDFDAPVLTIDSLQITEETPALKRLTWFGHSACLLEMDGKRIFFDPMLAESLGPLPLLGPKRYNKELPITIESLPYIDAVVLSHDHYDHLDYESIIKLKDKVGRFYVPLGVKAHLIKWGVHPDQVTELDWWEESSVDGFTFVCTPARHFSGRGLFDRFTTLWASWIVKTENSNVFFSGDSGYGPHFKEIGNQYGPFDFVMLECGQYNPLWEEIHMMPEQTVQAAIDLRGKLMMPIHWGAFTLAMHTWTDPIERATVAAHAKLVHITTPRIGEPVFLQEPVFPQMQWWKFSKGQ